MNDATKIVGEDEMMDLESVLNEIKAMSQEQFDALMEEVRAMSEPPYDETVNEEPAVAPMNQADISENSRYKELKVNPCAYGVHFSAVMDDEDGSIVVFGEGGWAMGYIDLKTARKPLSLDMR